MERIPRLPFPIVHYLSSFTIILFVLIQVFLSTRRGAWVLNRVGEHGIPSDMLGNRRIVQLVRNHLPRSLYAYHLEKQLNQRFDHALYGMKPQHRIDEQHPTVSDELPNRISCGMVVVKPDIKRFTETGVEFVDGTVEEKIDVIFLATGYVFGFPFLEEDVIKVEKNKVDLFKYVFPPQLNPPTLAVIGCVQPWGAINPISEIQCRWVTRVFKVCYRRITLNQFLKLNHSRSRVTYGA